MRTMVTVLASLALVFAVLVSCAPQAPVAPAAPVAAQQQGVSPAPVAVPAVAPWQKEWDKVLEAAKKEGKVVVYSTGGAETRSIITRLLKEKFGLNAEMITARGAEVAEKVLAERRAGLHIPDIYIGGATTIITQLKPAGVFDSFDQTLILPEVADPKVWWGGRLNWVDKEHQIFMFEAFVSGEIGINTELVKPEEIKTMDELMNPKWKGKIIINDPTVAGTGAKYIGVWATRRGWDYWRELVKKQEPVVLRDQRLQVEWLARGKGAILVVPKPEPLSEFMKAGAAVKTMPIREAQYISGDVISLMKNAPHPNAAKVFVNWFIGPEGQKLYSEAQGTISARDDVVIDPRFIVKEPRQPGVDYFNTITESFLLEQGEHMKISKEVFGSLIK